MLPGLPGDLLLLPGGFFSGLPGNLLLLPGVAMWNAWGSVIVTRGVIFGLSMICYCYLEVSLWITWGSVIVTWRVFFWIAWESVIVTRGFQCETPGDLLLLPGGLFLACLRSVMVT